MYIFRSIYPLGKIIVLGILQRYIIQATKYLFINSMTKMPVSLQSFHVIFIIGITCAILKFAPHDFFGSHFFKHFKKVEETI